MSVTFNTERRRAVYLNLLGQAACLNKATADESTPQLSIELNTPAPDRAENDNQAQAMLEGYGGRVFGAELISADGRTVSATVTHPQFAARDWRCVDGYSWASNNRIDDFEFPFSGYEPKSLTTRTAVTALKSELTRRYGPAWEKPGSWTACPSEEFFPEGITGDTDSPQALCEFRFSMGSRWRHGSVLLGEQLGDIVTSSFSSSAFRKAIRTCRPLRTLRAAGVFDRRLRAGGWVGCRDNSASMIRDLHQLKPGVRRVGFHGTNRAGFEDAVTFRCVLRARPGGRRSAACANALDDRFVYKFRLAARKRTPSRPTEPRRPESRRKCTPGYSVCMPPGRGDYDCRGGSGNGPNYVRGPVRVSGFDPYDLDSDDNGVGCEQ